MTQPSVAVDAGQTQVRAVLVDGHGPVAEAPGVERINGAAVDADAVAAALLAAISGLSVPAGAGATVAVGLSGFEAAGAGDLGRVEARLREELRAARVVIASDGVTSLLGALGVRSGAVVAAGTGTIVVARGSRGWARVDGWGSLLGDAGSGFAIGRAGLDAALRELDGRGGSPALLAAAVEHFDTTAEAETAVAPARSPADRAGPTLETASLRSDSGGAVSEGAAIVAAVHGAEVPTRAVAGFAEVVGRLAGEGDAASVRILADAAEELALSASAALDRALGDDEPATVSYAGNVFRAGQPLLEPFAQALVRHRPGTTLVAPAADALAGAAMLARDPDAVAPQPGLLWRAA